MQTDLQHNSLSAGLIANLPTDAVTKFMDIGSTKGTLTTKTESLVGGKLVTDENVRQSAMGGIITPKTAGIFELHQGEMVLDNAAVAAFTKALNMNTTSQENALAETGGGTPIIINNNNVDNSMQSSQTTAVSMPAPTRSNESTLRALQMS